MRLATALAILGASHTLVLAQSKDTPCITNCTTKNAVSSQCNGDETGAALDKCLCNTFAGAKNMFACIKLCPAADQAIFAADLPASCRDSLLPGVTPASGTTAGSGASSTPTPTPTTSTGGGGGQSPSTTASGTATTKSPNAGAVMGGQSGIVVVGGLVAAMLL